MPKVKYAAADIKHLAFEWLWLAKIAICCRIRRMN